MRPRGVVAVVLVVVAVAAGWAGLAIGAGPAGWRRWIDRSGTGAAGGATLSMNVDPVDARAFRVTVTGPPGRRGRFQASADLGPTVVDLRASDLTVMTPGAGGFATDFSFPADGQLATDVPMDVVPAAGLFVQAFAESPAGTGERRWTTDALGVWVDAGTLVVRPAAALVLRRHGRSLIAGCLVVAGVVALLLRRWWAPSRGAVAGARLAATGFVVLAAWNAAAVFRGRELRPGDVFRSREEQLAAAFEPGFPELVSRCRTLRDAGARIRVVAMDPPGLKVGAALRLLVPGIDLLVDGNAESRAGFGATLYLGAAARAFSGPAGLRGGAFALVEAR